MWRSCYGGLERSQGAVKQNRPAPRVGGWEVGDSWVRAEVTPGSSWQEKQGGVGSMGTGEAWAAVCCAGGRERPVWTRGWRLCWGGGLSWAQGRSWAGQDWLGLSGKGCPWLLFPSRARRGRSWALIAPWQGLCSRRKLPLGSLLWAAFLCGFGLSQSISLSPAPLHAPVLPPEPQPGLPAPIGAVSLTASDSPVPAAWAQGLTASAA